VSFAASIQYLALYLMSVLRSPANSMNSQSGLDVFGNIGNLHGSMQVHIDLADDQVVAGVVWPLNDDMLIGVSQEQVLQANRPELNGGTSEEGIHHSVSSESVALALEVEGTDWGVVGHLLCAEAEVWLDNFVSLPQNGVERLPCAIVDLSILSEDKDGNLPKAFVIVCFLEYILHDVALLGLLSYLLEHADGLVQPYGHGDASEVLADCAFDN
jgi:hypothetical protein